MNLLKSVRNMLTGEPMACRIVKPSDRAKRLANAIGRPLDLSSDIAAKIDQVKEAMMKRSEPHPSKRYATVADHFAGASSHRRRLALWEALVRYQKPVSILELGTAYGLSAIAMAMAQEHPNVTTVDFFEPQASVGPENIRNVLGAGVECVTQDKNLALPAFVEAGKRFDYVFHDGGHSGDAYVNDFEKILPMLEPQSLYVIDDIAWDNSPEIRRLTTESRRTCYEGWLELVEHGQVEGALELKGIGILLLR